MDFRVKSNGKIQAVAEDSTPRVPVVASDSALAAADMLAHDTRDQIPVICGTLIPQDAKEHAQEYTLRPINPHLYLVHIKHSMAFV